MKSEIKKNFLKLNAYYVGLSFALVSLFPIMNNYYTNSENNIKKIIDKELKNKIEYKVNERKINDNINRYIHKSLIEKSNNFVYEFKNSLDSIIDNY